MPPYAPFDDMRAKVAIVTGGTRGLGRSVAQVLDSVGARVLIVGRDEAAGEALAAGLRDSAFLQADLEDDDIGIRIIDYCIDRFGGVDVLVNNAGIFPLMDFGAITQIGMQRMFKINTLAPILLMQAAAKQMLTQPERGSIVNVLSSRAFRARPEQLVYGSTKAALGIATKAAAAALASRGVRVNAVAPGGMDHGDGGRAAALGLTEDEYEDYVSRLIARIPLGRKSASREVAAAVLFLCSSMSSAITGVILPCDGGETI
jgi:NAD(P)-dependent dehydrogenase (short-subunit alcohol dehydrogenase family)